MNDLFDQFGGLMNIAIAAVIGLATYFLAGKNLVWAMAAGLIGLVLVNVVGKKPSTVTV
jgi:hypothetical protein